MKAYQYLTRRMREFAADAVPHVGNLYVSRPVLNSAAVYQWLDGRATAHDLNRTEFDKPTEYHVTIAYSREPVDWSRIVPQHDQLVLNTRGYERRIQQFGSAIVLELASEELQQRFTTFREAGCSYDFESYRPHITIAKGQTEKTGWEDIANAYEGAIVLGPEQFAAIQDD